MAHHKGYGEKLEEAREGKAVMNKAGLLQHDGRQADSACAGNPAGAPGLILVFLNKWQRHHPGCSFASAGGGVMGVNMGPLS